MAGDDAITVTTLNPQELRISALHLAAALHHLQTCIPETVRAIRHAQSGRHANFGPIENSLEMSREELAKALDILVKDAEDAQR
jgi:hypothetical protein